MSTCWISDQAGSKCAASGGGGGRGLTVVEGVAVDGGGVQGGRPSPLSPRPARVRETLAARSSTYKTTSCGSEEQGERTKAWDPGYLAGRSHRRWRRGGGRRRRHFPRSPAGEDGVKRRPSPDLGATNGGRGRDAGYRPYKRGAKTRSGASAWNPSHRERREEGEKVMDDTSWQRI